MKALWHEGTGANQRGLTENEKPAGLSARAPLSVTTHPRVGLSETSVAVKRAF